MSLVRFRPEAPSNLPMGDCDAGVAHPVERHLAKVEVASSSLVTRSKWYRGQVVRQESAKLSFASSNLAGTSKKKTHTSRCAFSFWRNRTARFEPLNATPQWGLAREGLTGRHHLFSRRKEKCRQIRQIPVSTVGIRIGVISLNQYLRK